MHGERYRKVPLRERARRKAGVPLLAREAIRRISGSKSVSPLGRSGVEPKLIWNFYAVSGDLTCDPERRARMFDLLYLAAGLGFFALMGAYARWAGEA